MVSSRAIAEVLVDALTRIFGDRLRSIVAYGPSPSGDARPASLVLVSSVSAADLEACAREARRWRRRGLTTPLILPEAEFRRSLDAFPLEYGEILRSHTRVFGDDPFADVSIDRAHLRRAIERQVTSHLLHVREEFIETDGRPQQVVALLRDAAPAFASLLRHVAWLAGTEGDRSESARAGARLAGLDGPIVEAILALEAPGDVSIADPSPLFADYLAAVERLRAAVDTWRDAPR